MHSLRAGTLTVLAVGCIVAQTGATPPTPPGRIVLTTRPLEGSVSAKPTVELPVEIAFTGAVGRAELTAVVRRSGGPIAYEPGETVTRLVIDAGKGQTQRAPVVIKLGPPGEYEIDLRLKGSSGEGHGFSDRALRNLVIEPDGRYRIVTPKERVGERRRARERRFEDALKTDPDRPRLRLLLEDTVRVPDPAAEKVTPHRVPAKEQLSVRPAGPSERLRRYSVDHGSRSWSSKDPITVRGRLTYLDFDGVWRPLVNVSVNLWDEDTGWDEHLGVTVTDWSGNWSFSVNNDDGWLADGRDIYYSFKLENTRIRVEDCDGIDSVYEWESAVHDDLSDGAIVDFGTETGSTNAGAMQVWNHFNLAWTHSVVNGGQDPGFVDSCFPEDETHWDRFWEEVDVEAQYTDGPDVVTHEYAHAVMWYAYDDDNPSPGGSHGFDDCTEHSGQAWSEGWATGFMLAGRPDGVFNWHEGDGGRAIEGFDAACREGNTNEGRVAAALVDMLDSPDDCNGGDEDRGRNGHCDANNGSRVSFATMLRDTLWGSWHTDMVDYWYSLSGELSSPQRTPANTIMFYNWMPVVEPGSCVASKVVARESRDPEALLTGLRRLRDNGLKTFDGGRFLSQLYYRHSPELGAILMKDPDGLQRALRLVGHAARLGDTLAQHKSARTLVENDTALFPGEVAADFEGLMTLFERQGSDDLRRDLREVGEIFAEVRQLTVSQAIEKVMRNKEKRPGDRSPRLHQSELSPASERLVGPLAKELPQRETPIPDR
jgi:hypothetical protein